MQVCTTESQVRPRPALLCIPRHTELVAICAIKYETLKTGCNAHPTGPCGPHFIFKRDKTPGRASASHASELGTGHLAHLEQCASFLDHASDSCLLPCRALMRHRLGWHTHNGHSSRPASSLDTSLVDMPQQGRASACAAHYIITHIPVMTHAHSGWHYPIRGRCKCVTKLFLELGTVRRQTMAVMTIVALFCVRGMHAPNTCV